MGESGWQADAVSVSGLVGGVLLPGTGGEQVCVWGSALFDLDIRVGWGGETDSNKELKNQIQLA